MNVRLLTSLVLLTLLIACGKSKETSTTPTENSVTDVIGLDNGRWIDTNDPTSGVEIKDGTIMLFSKSDGNNSERVFSYELYEEAGVEYLRLQNDTEEIIYGLLEYSDENMILDRLGLGKAVTYRKEN